jgi:hypothetical protein
MSWGSERTNKLGKIAPDTWQLQHGLTPAEAQNVWNDISGDTIQFRNVLPLLNTRSGTQIIDAITTQRHQDSSSFDLSDRNTQLAELWFQQALKTSKLKHQKYSENQQLYNSPASETLQKLPELLQTLDNEINQLRGVGHEVAEERVAYERLLFALDRHLPKQPLTSIASETVQPARLEAGLKASRG